MGKSPSFGILDDNDCDEVESSEEATKNLQSWLPDGWIMVVYRGDDGTIYQYYICPVSGSTFTMKSEVLHYLFSEMDQRFMESKNCAVGCNLMRTHEWLPKGWLVEIRAGGDNMDKMYKFYVYPPHRVRLFSKDDVLLYIKEMKISGIDTDGQCNTRLPQGWVKEVVFGKTNTGGIRRDRHYTDPIKNYVFHTMRSAALYVETGKVTIRAFVQKTSVQEVYSFEKFTHLHESLQKRLNLGRTNQLRTRSSKLEKLALKEEILSDEQGSSSDGDSDYSATLKEARQKKANRMKTSLKGKEVMASTSVVLEGGPQNEEMQESEQVALQKTSITIIPKWPSGRVPKIRTSSN
uniref:MBD domain-containing protein n=1 Tax=Oryza barthii TaxID=65489 RepID=A0A0D3FSV5_9ORYZ